MTIKKTQITGFFVTAILGTLLHFVFQWTGQWAPAGAISAVNESIWEHLKMLVIPMLLWSVPEYFSFGKGKTCFIPIRFKSILLGMAVITAGFYTYSGILGFDVPLVDIILFFLAVLIAYIYSYKSLIKDCKVSVAVKKWSIAGLILLMVIFIVFTYYPPHISLFADPGTLTFGIRK